MIPTNRSALRRRLRSLLILEIVNIPLQAWIWFSLIGLPVTPAGLVGFALFSLLLLQGAGYWAVKVHQLGHATVAPKGLGFFAVARFADVPVLAGGLGYTVYAVISDPGAGSIPGLCFAVFAVLEYVNYFHVQLMYDNAADLCRLRKAGLQRSHLSRDLSRHSGRGTAAVSAHPS